MKKKILSLALALFMVLTTLPITTLAADTITVQIVVGNGGSARGGGQYTSGETVTLTATPDDGYLFDGWYENSYNGMTMVSSSKTYTFTAGPNDNGTPTRVLSARFQQQSAETYTIYAYANGGSVSGGGTYTQGNSVTLIATAYSGYTFDGWYENLLNQGDTKVSSDTTYTFTATSDRRLTAKFVKQPVATYTIYAYSSGGRVSGDGEHTHGSTVRLSIIPDTDYNFLGWYEDGVLVSSSTTYTFTATSDRRLEARVLYKDATHNPYDPSEPPIESGYQYFEGKLISTQQDSSGRSITMETQSGSWLASGLADGCVITIDNVRSSFASLTGNLYIKLQIGNESGSVVRITATTQGSSLSDFVIQNGVLTEYQGAGGAIVIPGSVASIGDYAFWGCESLTSVTIPNSVTSIGEYAFSSCEGLRGVTMPDSITSIGDHAFYHCTSLTSVTIPNSVTSIGHSAFYQCDSLTSVVIPESVTIIARDTFRKNAEDFPVAGLTIYGKAGSEAEAYAQLDGIHFRTGTPDNPGAVPTPILDSASVWARESIASAIDKGFVPLELRVNYTGAITRAEFCRMAVSWVQYELGQHKMGILIERGLSYNILRTFEDTRDHDILTAYALGITSGTRAPTADRPGTFDPDGLISREQAATMIMNTCRIIGVDVENAPAADFVDLGTASSWAIEGIHFVQASGIMQGVGNNTFSPKSTYTREQSIITFNNIK